MLRWVTWGLAVIAVALAGFSSVPLFVFLFAAGWVFVRDLSRARSDERIETSTQDRSMVRRRADVLQGRVARRLLDADIMMAGSSIAAVDERFRQASHVYIRASAKLDRAEAAAAIAELTEADWLLDCAEAVLRGESMPPRPVLWQPKSPRVAQQVCPDCLEPNCLQTALPA